MKHLPVIAVLAASLSASMAASHNAHAETAFDHIFRTGTLTGTTRGEVYTYRQLRSVPAQNVKARKSDLVLDVVSDTEVAMTIYRDQGRRGLGTYPKDVGNPVQMYFLEQVISDMARSTGGSPFYIRNRLKAALVETEAVPAKCPTLPGQCILVTPFADDAARDRMQDFADLQLSFMLDDANPVWIMGMAASNPELPDGYEFRIELE